MSQSHEDAKAPRITVTHVGLSRSGSQSNARRKVAVARLEERTAGARARLAGSFVKLVTPESAGPLRKESSECPRHAIRPASTDGTISNCLGKQGPRCETARVAAGWN